MASTYSNLKFQLMATGENSGTWGNVTNVNLGTAIEEAIVGSADVAFSSADVTLTLTDSNASQAARNLRLNLTGTSGGNRNLIVPAIEKIYIINNGLANQVTVKNATGTGVVVPAGKTMYVYNDGTNVVDAITHLTSLTLGTPLPVASGGTGSATAAFSGANITSLNASNISTGTINNARTTASSSNGASTIVARDASGNFSANTITANLNGNASTANTAGTLSTARTIGISGGATGTATSFNGGSNITIPVTGLDVSTANAGTLAVARGGTGVTSAGTSGNVLTSNGSAWVSQAISAGGDYIMRTYTSPATWAKPAGLKAVKVTVIGGGGGSGGVRRGENISASGGGGGGGAGVRYIAAPSIPGPVVATVGVGGNGGPAPGSTNTTTTGGTGGTSSFGSFVSATGGGGSTAGGGGGGIGSSGNLNVRGDRGDNNPGFLSAGFGGGTVMAGYASAGVYGGGANGVVSPTFNSPQSGRPGAAGVVVVEEFY